ncbi:MAG TPA: flavodoxin family protein [Bacteroidales bacterium]
MKTTVVYYSKTGNTKIIADSIAKTLGCNPISINLLKNGRKTKLEIEEEKEIVKNAVEQCNQSDLVFIGTPTEFRKPHTKIVDLINELTVKKAAIFCTYYGMLGATFYDLESLLWQRNISIVNKLNVPAGTRKYQFNRDVSQYKDKITPEHIQMACDFALRTITLDKPLPLRLKGICGIDCKQCSDYNKSCKGAGYDCWSGRNCAIFDCCVIKKSYLTCEECNGRLNCNMVKNRKCNFA